MLALDALGTSKADICRQVGKSFNTITAVLKNTDHTDPRIVERVKREMAAQFWVTGHRALNNVTEEKLENSSAFQLVGMAGLATDKALLLEGKPTARIEHVNLSDAEAASKIEELQATLDGWKDGTIINVGTQSGGEETVDNHQV